MATDVVEDSSIIVALVTPEKYSEWASKSLQKYEYIHVLDLSFYEVANAIAQKIHNGLDARDASLAFRKAEKMMNLSMVHSFSEVGMDALNKALDLQISVYDTAFLSLADKMDMQLLTLDLKLAKRLEPTKYARLIEYPNEKESRV